MSDARQVVRSFVNGHYGELMNVTEPQFDGERRLWEAELVSYYPRIINDDSDREKSIIKFVYLAKLGKVELDEHLNLVYATPNSKCSDLVGERFSMYRQKAERIMVEASAWNLAGLTDALHVLNPVVKVIDNLLDKEAKIPEIRDKDFDNRDNVKRYWKLLEEAEIVMRVPGTESGYSSGKEFVRFLEMFKNDREKLINAVLGHIISRKYASLRSVFEVAELEPHIHVDNSYYWPALEADQSVHMSIDSIRERFNYAYNATISIGRLTHYLQELKGVDCLRQDSGGWHANDKLFEEMREIRGSALEAPTLRV